MLVAYTQPQIFEVEASELGGATRLRRKPDYSGRLSVQHSRQVCECAESGLRKAQSRDIVKVAGERSQPRAAIHALM